MEEPLAFNLATLLRQQESLRQVIESISSELELRPLLILIMRHACELLNAENGTIGLVDFERNVVRTEAAFRMPPDELGAEIPPGVGLFGHILETQEPVIWERYGQVKSPTQHGLLDFTVIGVPIFWRGKLIGVFGLGSPPPRRFTKYDIEVLTLFAKHAAIAIENARRYEQEHQRTERLSQIARIGHILTADIQLKELLQNASDAIHDLLGYRVVSIPLLAPNNATEPTLHVVSGHYRGLLTQDMHIPIRNGIMGAAVRERRTQLVNDVMADPRYIPIPGAAGITAEISVPILAGGQVLGVLNVESGGHFTEDDANSLQIIADQLAVAIENARLFAEKQHALDEMQLLYETTRRTSTAMNSDEVIAAYLEYVAAQGRYTCTVILYETDAAGRKVSVLVRGRWTKEEGIAVTDLRLPYAFDALDPMLDAGQTVTIADVETDPLASPKLREIQRESKRPAIAMIPLIAHSRRIGLVILSHTQIHQWSEADLRPYQATAPQLATAIHSRNQYLLLVERGQQVAVLEERQRLARDLHDSVTQLLFSMTLFAQSIGPAWQRSPEEGEQYIERLLGLSQSALAEMRALLTNLRPPKEQSGAESISPFGPGISFVRREGLPAALQRYIAEMDCGGTDISIRTEDYLPQPVEQEETLFRITQESLNNVVKHAQARSVQVRLWRENGCACLTVRDDGKGFQSRAPDEPPAVSKERSGGMGLAIMRERAEAEGGSFHITTVPGRGTIVEVALPEKG